MRRFLLISTTLLIGAALCGSAGAADSAPVSGDDKRPNAALGMPEAFSEGADLSGINGMRDLHVQGVIHKAIISVDEKGTTAAAATGITVGTTSIPTSLVVDRPFLFFIRHNPTGAILFQGRVVDPSK